jgi:hypothetical protein
MTRRLFSLMSVLRRRNDGKQHRRRRQLLVEALEDRRLLAIISPYADVDWQAFGQFKGNFHTHTTQSDGSGSPAAMIDAYRNIGYSILALTDHDTMTTSATTWPWTDYGRDPADLGMVAIRGNEISRPHHIGSYFNDYGDGNQTSESAALAEIGDREGLAVMLHPGRYSRSVDWYVDLYENNSHLIGMEVYNQGDRYPGDRALWDQVLTRLMPQTPVWGFSNDDAHNATSHVGRNWQTFILPELTEAAVRDAMIGGQFYFSYALGGHPAGGGDPAPVINSIVVDDTANTITINATGYTNISWISAGAEIASGVVTLDVSDHQGYVRAELTGPTGKTYTQPFFAGDPNLGTPQPFFGIPVKANPGVLQTFTTRPETTDGWATASIAGSSSTHQNADALDAKVQTLNVSGITTRVGSSGTWPPTVDANVRWNSSEQVLQTRPSGNATAVLLATLENATGQVVNDLFVYYDFGSWMLQENEHVYGHRTFYSLDGTANSWVLIPEFSNHVRTTQAGATRLSAQFALPDWQPGAPLYILWADDNGPGGSENSGTGREGAYTINNFGVSLTPPALALQVGSEGLPTQTFDTKPSTLFWSTTTVSGGASNHQNPSALDNTVQSLTAGMISAELVQTANLAANSRALWNSAAQRIQTRPTDNAATVLMATLENATGQALDSLYVWYDFGSWLLREDENVFGHRSFYSLSGQPNTWVPIPEFSEFLRTTLDGERRLVAELDFTSSWAAGERLYIVWADDNGPGGSDQSGTGREGAYTIDNFGAGLTAPTVEITGISVGPDGRCRRSIPRRRPRTAGRRSPCPGAPQLTSTLDALDATVQSFDAQLISTALPQHGSWPPASHNLARWNSSRQLLQTHATGVAATVLMATL